MKKQTQILTNLAIEPFPDLLISSGINYHPIKHTLGYNLLKHFSPK